MCQLRAVIERDGEKETVMDSVTALEVVDDGVVLNTFFEEPRKVTNVMIKRIDFLGGAVVLNPVSAADGE